MNDSLVYEEDGLPTKEESRSSSPSKRNRIFDEKSRNHCWQKADVVAGRHPERWRKDVAGNIVCRKLTRCEGCLCYEYDHIRPFSKGGETDVKNCQILQSRVNRFKSNRSDVDSYDLKQFSCNLKFTGQSVLLYIEFQSTKLTGVISDRHYLLVPSSSTCGECSDGPELRDFMAALQMLLKCMDFIFIFADKRGFNLRPLPITGKGLLCSKIYTISSGVSCLCYVPDKELDVIEMAVYGNVVRPGLQCKCKSVAENLGTALYKQKGPEVSSCQLPYTSTS